MYHHRIGISIIDLEKIFEMSTSDGVGANATITIPIITSPTFRLEPEVGYFSATQDATIRGTTTGFYIAPAIGGEHNFSVHFSIDAEAQVVYASLTNEKEDRDFDFELLPTRYRKI